MIQESIRAARVWGASRRRVGAWGAALRCVELAGDLDSLQGLMSSRWLTVRKSHWPAAVAMASCLIQGDGGATQLWTEANWWRENSRRDEMSKSVHFKVCFVQRHTHTIVSGQELLPPSVDSSRGPRMTAWYRWHRHNLTTWLQLLRFYPAAPEHLCFKFWDLGQNDSLCNMDEPVTYFSPNWIKSVIVTSDYTFLNHLKSLPKCFKLYLSCISTCLCVQ